MYKYDHPKYMHTHVYTCEIKHTQGTHLTSAGHRLNLETAADFVYKQPTRYNQLYHRLWDCGVGVGLI